MKKCPIHSVEYMPSLVHYDLNASDKIQIGARGEIFKVQEYQQRGNEKYAIVQTRTNADGSPHYTAFISNKNIGEMLAQRIEETNAQMVQRNKEALSNRMVKIWNESPKTKNIIASFDLKSIEVHNQRTNVWHKITPENLQSIIRECKENGRPGPEIRMDVEVLENGQRAGKTLRANQALGFEFNGQDVLIETRSQMFWGKSKEQEREFNNHNIAKNQRDDAHVKAITMEEGLAVKYAQTQVYYLAGPDVTKIYDAHSNERVNPYSLQCGKEYKIDCNMINMYNPDGRAPIFSGELIFKLSDIQWHNDKMVVELDGDAKLMNHVTRECKNVHGVITNLPFQEQFVEKKDMAMSMGQIQWSNYQEAFSERLEMNVERANKSFEMTDQSRQL